MNKWFSNFSNLVSDWVGTHYAFISSLMIVVVWVVYAIPHKFSSDAQMPINSFTTVVTFLMVFLIQRSQNRHAKEMELKIDELIRAIKNARNDFINLKTKDDKELKRIEEEFKNLK